MTIDWKNAPEGATHYSPETDATHAVFYKDDFKQMWIEKGPNLGWQEAHRLSEHERPIPRPTPTVIPELKKLTQAVFDGLPPEYRWAAVYPDGLAIACTVDMDNAVDKQLYDLGHVWAKIGIGSTHDLGTGYDATDWQNSKIERQKTSQTLEAELSALRTQAVADAAEIERLKLERDTAIWMAAKHEITMAAALIGLPHGTADDWLCNGLEGSELPYQDIEDDQVFYDQQMVTLGDIPTAKVKP